MDPDVYGAIVLAIIAALMLIVGCAIVLGGKSETRRPTPPPAFQAPAPEDSDWTDADRYHGSRQWGR